MTTPTQPPAATPDHQYSSPHANTESERQLFKSIACACASVGLLYDDGLKDAIYGFVLPHQSRIERENVALREALEQHKAYAHMMQEQRSQIAAYCHTIEKQIDALKPNKANP